MDHQPSATIRDALTRNRAWYCLECGKCSAVCPITRWERRAYTSPRLLVEKAIEGGAEELRSDLLFWSCLTCKRCSELCPSDVYFSEFLRDARRLARVEGHSGDCTHGGAIQTLAQMMTRRELQQDRLGWLRDDLRVSDTSDTLYFVGCLPYYDTMFRPIGAEGIEIAQACVKILNHLGITPRVLADERCCGHDQLWEGDLDTFRALATLNLQQLRAPGIKRVVTACPECARTIKTDYPRLVGEHNLETVHISELVASSPLMGTKPRGRSGAGLRITYQDPCRLGRHLRVYDAPRQVLADLGVEIAEMERSRKTSLCCGSSCWTACGQVSKNIQVERLREAQATGAELLVTACPKCQIHFKCAQSDPLRGRESQMPVRDWTSVVASLL